MTETKLQDLLWIALMDIPGLGVRTALRLRERFGTVEDIWRADYKRLSGVSRTLADTIAKGPNLLRIQEKIDHWNQQEIQVLSIDNEKYPRLLKQIPDPPPLLYAMGRVELLQSETMAVVGARRSSAYGEQAALDIGSWLVRQGYTVVSGMAVGIDACAHEGALQARGPTIAVLGCGVDVCYPIENTRLYSRIHQQGLILSELPPGTKPKAGFFPLRNRIISGLSRGVVLVEAGEKSGSLITADRALDQGRDVYAVPGSMFSMRSRGTHRLIQEGGAMILCELSDLPSAGGAPKDSARDEAHSPAFSNSKEQILYEAIRDEGVRLEELFQTGLDIGELQQILSIFEVRGLVRQAADQRWVRVKHR